MQSIKISLSMAESVKFVATVNKYPYDIGLRSGRFVIDAKSILGIFSLDLSRPLVLEIHSEKADELIEELKSRGMTILLVEQNAQMALSIANRGYVLETGKVVMTADAKDLLNDDSVRKAYLGA